MSNRSLLMRGATALALALALGAPAEVQAASPQDVTLSRARLDMLADGRIVVSFDASGAIRGLLTLQIDRSADAARGQWVLVSRYLQDVTPDGAIDDRAQEVRASLPGEELHLLHKEYIRIEDRGTLRGSIAGGTLDFDVDGKLRSIGALKLAVDGGCLAFEGLTGSAVIDASNLHEGTSGTGTLRLSAAPAAEGVK